MAKVTPIKTFVSGETVTPDKLNQLSIPTVTIDTGEVTPENLRADVAFVPAGAVMPFAMNSAPTGWLAADGGEYSKTGEYANLFGAIGTVHGETNGSGGAGTTHFRVPDLRGYFVRGYGSGSGSFGQRQADSIKTHYHTGTTGANGGHSHTFSYIYFASTGGGGDGLGRSWSYYYPTASGTTSSQADHTHPFTTNPTGDSETRPANIALLYCIKT